MPNPIHKKTPSNTSSFRSIGVMDSGVGGLSVLHHINNLMPYENLTYVADSQYAPYGSLSSEKITERCFAVADFLITKNVKAIVVACNTATAASIRLMRAKYTIPIIGIEPAIKPATLVTKNKIIGVLATVNTLKSSQFSTLLATYSQDIQVHTQGCAGLVECIERGEIYTPKTKKLLSQYCSSLINAGADTIVLGCTHYPFVHQLIKEIVGDDVNIIDTGVAVATHLQRVLKAQALLSPIKMDPSIVIWTNNIEADSEGVIQQLWKNKDVDIKMIV